MGSINTCLSSDTGIMLVPSALLRLKLHWSIYGVVVLVYIMLKSSICDTAVLDYLNMRLWFSTWCFKLEMWNIYYAL